jgi:hypothetical protein
MDDKMSGICLPKRHMVIVRILICAVTLLAFSPIYSWGDAGHRIVAEIARKHLDADVLKAVEQALDGTSFSDASVWMDEVRREKRYYHMAPWHYVNLEKGAKYKKHNKEENVINELRFYVKKLNNRNKYDKNEIAVFLKILFHLVGDLHQPLHTGYGSDRGGNNVFVQMNGKATNLHGVWDYEIIAYKNIVAGDCMALEATMSESEMQEIRRLNVFQWFDESRAEVEPAYQIGKDGVLDQAYINAKADVMKRQMLKAGIRLAAVLTRLYQKGSRPMDKDDQEDKVPTSWAEPVDHRRYLSYGLNLH